MAMTNEAFQSMIDEYGDRIFYINLNNEYKMYIGYESSHIISVKDLKLKNIGGVDMFGVPNVPPDAKLRNLSKKNNNEPVYYTWHCTEYIETIGVMEEKYNDYRPDPIAM